MKPFSRSISPAGSRSITPWILGQVVDFIMCCVGADGSGGGFCFVGVSVVAFSWFISLESPQIIDFDAFSGRFFVCSVRIAVVDRMPHTFGSKMLTFARCGLSFGF